MKTAKTIILALSITITCFMASCTDSHVGEEGYVIGKRPVRGECKPRKIGENLYVTCAGDTISNK